MSEAGLILSEADHEHFLEHGYVVVRQAVPPQAIARAVAALEEDSDSEKAREATAACATDKVHDAIDELLGGGYTLDRVRGGRDMARPHVPDGDWPDPVAHVDDAYPTIMPNGWAVGSFIFLTRVKARGGAFVCFPGSPWRYRAAMAQSCHVIKEAAGCAEKSGDYLEYLAAPGDLLLFHHLMGHCGSNNVSAPKVTRHALLARWHPRKRIVPGRKPVEAMTTIEKANSARYLEECRGADLLVPGFPTAAGMLREGLSLGTVRGYALLHYGGQAHLLYAPEAEPGVIRRRVSDDLIRWRDAGGAALDVQEIATLQLHQYGAEAILAVTEVSGRLLLYSTRNFERWQLLSWRRDCLTGTPWFAYAKYPTKVAGGQTLFTVGTGDPRTIVCRWGELWEGAGEWRTQSVAVQVEEEFTVADITLAAYFSDSSCAFVLDLQRRGEDGPAPYYVQPVDVAVAAEAVQPLVWSGASTPRRVRVFNRARRYWMVTYLERVGDEDRLYWGCIDWESDAPRLQQLETAAAFDEARCVVGIV